MTCFYLVGSRHFSQISEPFSITSRFLWEIFPAPHPQPPRALIWELLLSAACSALLQAYLLLTQKEHRQLLISLEPTDLPETSTVSALSPLLSFLLFLLGGGNHPLLSAIALSLNIEAQFIVLIHLLRCHLAEPCI